MSGSVNKVILVGNLGADPEVRGLPDGGEVANLRIATSESWKDRNTGERKEKTEWHSVAVFGDGLVNICKNYLRKGSKVYIEGQLQTRSYEKDGAQHFRTEVILRGFNSSLTMLDGANRDGDQGGAPQGGQRSQSESQGNSGNRSPAPALEDDGLDDIPF